MVSDAVNVPDFIVTCRLVALKHSVMVAVAPLVAPVIVSAEVKVPDDVVTVNTVEAMVKAFAVFVVHDIDCLWNDGQNP